MQQIRSAHDHAVILDYALYPAIAALAFEIRVGDYFLDHFTEKNARFLPQVVPAFEASNGKQASDQFVEPVSFEFNAFEGAVRFRSGALMRQRRCHVEP